MMEFPFEDRQECEGVHARAWLIRPEAIARPRSPWATGRPNGPLLRRMMIHVERIEVAGKPGEQDDIRLGDRPSRAFPLVADDQIVERQS